MQESGLDDSPLGELFLSSPSLVAALSSNFIFRGRTATGVVSVAATRLGSCDFLLFRLGLMLTLLPVAGGKPSGSDFGVVRADIFPAKHIKKEGVKIKLGKLWSADDQFLLQMFSRGKGGTYAHMHHGVIFPRHLVRHTHTYGCLVVPYLLLATTRPMSPPHQQQMFEKETAPYFSRWFLYNNRRMRDAIWYVPQHQRQCYVENNPLHYTVRDW